MHDIIVALVTSVINFGFVAAYHKLQAYVKTTDNTIDDQILEAIHDALVSILHLDDEPTPAVVEVTAAPQEDDDSLMGALNDLKKI